MIKLTDQTLSASALADMARYQEQINVKATYADQIAEAKRLWKPRNNTFEEIVSTLVKMCPGTRRCCYCEDARGEDIEHFRPKHLYPEDTFNWANYLFACSACNSNAKRDKFAVIDDTDVLHDVTRPKNALVIPPTTGKPALINPRFENPLQYLGIDIFRKFAFFPRQGLSTYDQLRAKYTIEVLQLNARVELVEWRKVSYRNFVGWADTYRRYKNEGKSHGLTEHVNSLKKYPHLAVWEEMKRVYLERDVKRWDSLKTRYETILELDTLFTKTPEVLTIAL